MENYVTYPGFVCTATVRITIQWKYVVSCSKLVR